MNTRRWIGMLLVAAVMLAGTISGAPGIALAKEGPVIIDSDMGTDDWMAILYLLQQPDLDVRAITVTGTGLAYCDPGMGIALGLLALAGLDGITVACGQETPLEGGHAFPDEWRVTDDMAAGLNLPPAETTASKDGAPDVLAEIVRASEVPVRILALGPLTNLALAFEDDPDLIDNVEMIYVMGGAVDVPGSYIEEADGAVNETAEWNIYCDPLAAAMVVESGAPLTFVPLDATNEVPVTMDFVTRLDEAQDTPEAEFVYAILEGSGDFIESGSYYFWDPLAAAVLTDEDLATLEMYTITVVTDEGPDSGRTMPDEEGFPVRVAVDADAAAFEDAFLESLNAE